ncbi:MAG: glycosyltransferase [Beduini sp.]|uniref:glycosyltransferase n=1 Tax=Beduini sp. TaxID=1922300 RepID=UPI0039A0EC13
MISIICICNNRKVYNEYLAKSLSKQHSCSYEILRIDNQGNRYPNAVSAFNSVIKQAKGEYLMFVHQDIALEDDYFLNKVESYFKDHPQTGIAGIAGVRDRKIYSNIEHSIPRVRVSEDVLSSAVSVNSLDECLFIIPRKYLLEYPFDEQVCDHWHLYTVEYCYRMKKLNKEVVVLPLKAYHLSQGDFMNEGYYETLLKVANKYHKDFDRLETTIRSWSTHPFMLKLNIHYLRYKKARMKKHG